MLTYEKIFGCDDTYHEVLEKSGIAGEPVKADVAYATNLVDGVQKHIDKIDETISEAAIGWALERMSKVDLSILRNATYEILFDRNIPKAVAIKDAGCVWYEIFWNRKTPCIGGAMGVFLL